MNKQPGVRPVVVRPMQPNSPQMRSLVRNATTMPVGVTANSVGLDDTQGQRLRRVLWVGTPMVIVLALMCGIWLAIAPAKSLHTSSLNNGAYAYNFLFYKSSETVNLVGGGGLKSQNKILAIAKPTSDPMVKECSEMGKKWKRAFTVAVEGVDRPVCVMDGTIFLVTFYYGKTKHLFEMTYPSFSAVNSEDVRHIVQSIKVAQE